MSVVQEVDSWKEQVMGREINSEGTLDGYTRWIKRFEAWRPGGDPGEGMVRDFDSFLQDEDRTDYPWENARGRSAPDAYAYRSRVGALSGVKLWLRHQYDVEVTTEVQNIAIGEPADFDPTVLEPAVVERVINDASFACDNPDCSAAVALGHDAILRGAELADVRREDVDLEEQTLYVRAKKGNESTHLKIGDTAWTKLRQHAQAHPDRDYLFRNDYDRAWTAAAWNQHFRRKHHEAGFHSFARHSAISNRLRQGEDFGQVYLRARHQNPSTTLKYVNYVGVDVAAPDWVE